MEQSITLTGLFIYPIKGARGIAVSSAEVTPRGLAHDRRFMLIDERGVFVSQRELPRLARLTTAIVSDELIVGMEGERPLIVPLRPWDGELQEVQVWRDRVSALVLVGEVSRVLSHQIGARVSLAFMPEDTRRAVDPAYGEPGDVVSFADGFPCLLTSEASRQHVELAAAEPIPMDRFRPNLVVAGAHAYAEDDWSSIQVGEVAFDVVKPCQRCVVTTVDQRRGEPVSKEPLRTLAKRERFRGAAMFGQNLVPRGGGRLRVGDSLTIARANGKN